MDDPVAIDVSGLPQTGAAGHPQPRATRKAAANRAWGIYAARPVPAAVATGGGAPPCAGPG